MSFESRDSTESMFAKARMRARDGIIERIAKFDRSTVRDTLTGTIDYEEGIKFYNLILTVTGEVAGTLFEGSDTIAVIHKGS